MRRRLPTGSSGGFSLIELLVVIMLLSVVGTVVSASIIRGFQVQARQTDQTDTLNRAKIALERMSREVRGANPLVTAEPQRLAIVIRRSDTVIVSGVTVPRQVRRLLTYVAVPGVAGTGRLDVTEQRRETINGVATTTTTTRQLLGGLTLSSSDRVFGYSDAATGALVGTLAPAAVRRVEMRVRVQRLKTAGTADLYQRVSLRNTEV